MAVIQIGPLSPLAAKRKANEERMASDAEFRRGGDAESERLTRNGMSIVKKAGQP